MNLPATVECTDLYDQSIMLPRNKLAFRPSAYGLIVYENKLLVLQSSHSGKFVLPGGAIELGETAEQAVIREVREETGLEVEIEKFLDWKQSLFYYNPDDTAWQSILFFYLCKPLSFDLLPNDQIDDGDAHNSQWLDITTLKTSQFLLSFHGIIKQLKTIYSE